jgi:hypothetical protein
MRPLTPFCLPLLLVGSARLAAQIAPDSGPGRAAAPLCYHARPRPACGAFLLTTFGGYLVLGEEARGGTRVREVADWGAMVNVSDRDAVGGSVFASLDEAGFGLGPAVRYRRWLPSSASLELALGTPLVTTTENIHGVRPELLRQTTLVGCGATACSFGVRQRARVSLGMEVGRVPGVVLTGLGSLAALFVSWVAAIDD